MSTTSQSFFATGLSELPDRHYTPPSLADALVKCVTISVVASVADFAAGTGNLLKAAARRWPRAALIAGDVDGAALAWAATNVGVSWTGCGDFLAADYDAAFQYPRGSRHDVVLLNPPFTQSSGRAYSPRGEFAAVRCSRAMAFVLTAAQYLSPRGQLAAILPTSTLTSVQDSEARRVLAEQFHFDVVVNPRYGHFEGLDVSVFVLRLTPRLIKDTKRSVQASSPGLKWEIKRGRLSVPRNKRKGVGLASGWIHTTSIRGGKVAERYKLPADVLAHYSAPGALLIPRVGSFSRDSILLLAESDREVLSDCLLALWTERRDEVEAAYDAMLTKFALFNSLYSGTGAPYVTNGRLQEFLQGLA